VLVVKEVAQLRAGDGGEAARRVVIGFALELDRADKTAAGPGSEPALDQCQEPRWVAHDIRKQPVDRPKRARVERKDALEPMLDPRFHQQAIDDYRAKRFSELEYLKKVSEIRKAVVCRKYDDVPHVLQGNEDAAALFGVLKPFITKHVNEQDKVDGVAADVAIDIWEIIKRNRKVGFWDDLDAQRRTVNEIDDYLYDDVKDGKSIALTIDDMDAIIERSMQLARHRMVN